MGGHRVTRPTLAGAAGEGELSGMESFSPWQVIPIQMKAATNAVFRLDENRLPGDRRRLCEQQPGAPSQDRDRASPLAPAVGVTFSSGRATRRGRRQVLKIGQCPRYRRYGQRAVCRSSAANGLDGLAWGDRRAA